MTTRDFTQSGRLKASILKGVLDENRMMENKGFQPRQVVSSKSQRNTRRSKAFTSLLFLAAFSVTLLFDTGSQPPEMSMTDNPISALLSPQSVNYAMLPASPKIFGEHSPQQAANFLRQPIDNQVQLNRDELLDYSLILNNDSVRLSSVFGLDVQTIVIDAGHGGKDPGAIGAMGTKEKDIVLDIALGLKSRLEDSGNYKVILTRENDKTMSLAERVELANSVRTDLFISLHVNALPQKGENLIETYYYGPPSDEETLRLAEQENRGSGLLTRDFENMIRKIGNTFKEQESANLASAIQHSLFTNVKKYDKNIADAGIKIAPFVVLLGVDAPSVLVEISCISKKQEELKLNLPVYRDEITSFLAEGTTRYLARRNLHVLKGEENGQTERSNSG